MTQPDDSKKTAARALSESIGNLLGNPTVMRRGLIKAKYKALAAIPDGIRAVLQPMIDNWNAAAYKRLAKELEDASSAGDDTEPWEGESQAQPSPEDLVQARSAQDLLFSLQRKDETLAQWTKGVYPVVDTLVDASLAAQEAAVTCQQACYDAVTTDVMRQVTELYRLTYTTMWAHLESAQYDNPKLKFDGLSDPAVLSEVAAWLEEQHLELVSKVGDIFKTADQRLSEETSSALESVRQSEHALYGAIRSLAVKGAQRLTGPPPEQQ